MHFYVDENRPDWPKPFDKTQPILSYGVLSSEADLDKVAEADLAALRKTLGVERLHAAELGVTAFQKLWIRCWSCRKITGYGLISGRWLSAITPLFLFFDRVFDQGLNPVVPWSAYWTLCAIPCC